MADLESLIQSQDAEPKDTDIDSAGFDMQLRFLRNQRFRSDTLDRQWLAGWTASVVSIWLIFVLVILFNNQRLGLSDPVLITLLGTTTLNVIGLSLIVLRGHFRGE